MKSRRRESLLHENSKISVNSFFVAERSSNTHILSLDLFILKAIHK